MSDDVHDRRLAPRRAFLCGGLALGASALVGLSAREARAAGTRITARLGQDQVEVGEVVYLEVSVQSDGREVGRPSFPGSDGLEIEFQGNNMSASVSFGTGQRTRRTSTKTYTYIVAATEPGEHAIEVEVEVDGETHRPAAAPKLIATGTGAAAAVVTDAAEDRPGEELAGAEVIPWPVIDKSQVYVGEQVVYQFLVFERTQGNLSISTAPTFKDFWAEDLEPTHANARALPREAIHGVAYRVHETMRRALFPQKAGTLVIGGPKVALQPSVSLLFGGQRGSQMPKRFTGRTLGVEVLPLPAKGQPANFPANNVGKFQIATQVDRTTLQQGEAVKVTVTIAGTGNIALLELGEWPTIEGGRTYEPKPETPQIDTKGDALKGSRSYTMLLVAERAGTLTVPAFELPYFDPQAERYVVARSEPITLEVEANPDAAPVAASKPAGSGKGDDDSDLLAEPLATDTLERVSPRARWLTPSRWWKGTIAGPALLGLGWLVIAARRRFGPDDDARRRSDELARRRGLMAEASAAVAGGDPANFYPKLGQLLQAAAVDRAGPDGVGLARGRLMHHLAAQGVDPDEIDELRTLLDACDAARFGAGTGDEASRREHFDRARALLAKKTWRPR